MRLLDGGVETGAAVAFCCCHGGIESEGQPSLSVDLSEHGPLVSVAFCFPYPFTLSRCAVSICGKYPIPFTTFVCSFLAAVRTSIGLIGLLGPYSCLIPRFSASLLNLTALFSFTAQLVSFSQCADIFGPVICFLTRRVSDHDMFFCFSAFLRMVRAFLC